MAADLQFQVLHYKVKFLSMCYAELQFIFQEPVTLKHYAVRTNRFVSNVLRSKEVTFIEAR